MFTGIVEEIGIIRNIARENNSIRLKIECGKIVEDVKTGDSIAVNGICLTVTSFDKKSFHADVMPETMRKTNLGNLKILDKVNLERALRLSDRLGGHIVSGHIDGTGTITQINEEDNAVWMTFTVSPELMKYIITKGSVAIDGTSLTVAYVDEKCFKVSLIPHTRGQTNLGAKSVGDMVNIECDMLGKYIEKLMAYDSSKNEARSGLTMDFLKENGFL